MTVGRKARSGAVDPVCTPSIARGCLSPPTPLTLLYVLAAIQTTIRTRFHLSLTLSLSLFLRVGIHGSLANANECFTNKCERVYPLYSCGTFDFYEWNLRRNSRKNLKRFCQTNFGIFQLEKKLVYKNHETSVANTRVVSQKKKKNRAGTSSAEGVS